MLALRQTYMWTNFTSIPIKALPFSKPVASSQLVDDMLSLIAEVRGLTAAHHDLFFACVEGGRPAEARKVLKVSTHTPVEYVAESLQGSYWKCYKLALSSNHDS